MAKAMKGADDEQDIDNDDKSLGTTRGPRTSKILPADDKSLGTTRGPRTSKILPAEFLAPAFHIIVKYMPDKWMELGHHLGIRHAIINATEMKYRGDPRACCRSVLSQWVTKNGKRATWLELEKVVTEIGHKDVSEKLQKKLCCFNEKDWRDPIDMAAFLSEDIVYYMCTSSEDPQLLMMYLDSMELSGHLTSVLHEGESNEQSEQQVARCKELRDSIDGLTSEILRNLKLKALKRQKKLKEENDCLEKELGLIPERENNMPGELKVIERKSLQKNGDSGFESTAPKSHTGSSADPSLARAKDKVPKNDTVDELDEDSSSDEASYQTASDGESTDFYRKDVKWLEQ